MNSNDDNHRQRSREKNKSSIQVIVSQKKQDIKKYNKIDDEEEFDMFADDEILPGEKNDPSSQGNKLISDTISTDQSGYYIPVNGSTIGSKSSYKIIDKLGKGVFGVVIKALKTDSNEECAIKILRKNQMTQSSGLRQFKILSQMHRKNKLKRIIKVNDQFYEKGHFCFVCEILGTDLRAFAHKKQPTLHQIRLYAISMFLISHELRISHTIHADIKPDNFMFKNSDLLAQFQQFLKNRKITDNQQLSAQKLRFQQKVVIDNLKLVDFGTSYSVQQYNNSIQYQVARYYRAPEIILGTKLKQSEIYAIDVWAIGCSLFQLYTNQFLFNGSSNNDMLKLMMETKGKFSTKMLNKSLYKDKHFDENYNFIHNYIDTFTKSYATKKIQIAVTPERQLMKMLKKNSNVKDEDPKKLQNFRDFLQRCLALNPRDRITPQQVMQHPFIQYQVKLLI